MLVEQIGGFGWGQISMNMDPTVAFVIVLVIGVAAGIIAQRIARPSWLSRQIAGKGRADLTSALVGIAGAFIGFHIAAIVALSAGMIVLFVSAVIGAVLVLWGGKSAGAALGKNALYLLHNGVGKRLAHHFDRGGVFDLGAAIRIKVAAPVTTPVYVLKRILVAGSIQASNRALTLTCRGLL